MAEAMEIKVDCGRRNDVLWARTRNFTTSQQNKKSTKLQNHIKNTQISEEMAKMICNKFNQRAEENRCGDPKSFADHMLYELQMTPRFTFIQVQPKPPPSFFSFLSFSSSSITSSSGSSSMLSSKMAEEFCKLVIKNLKSCKDNIMEVLGLLHIEKSDVLLIAKNIVKRILAEKPTEWKGIFIIFGEELWAVLGPRFFEIFEEDWIQRMEIKFQSLLVYIDFARTIGVDPKRAVFLWFTFQAVILFFQKVSIKIQC